MARPSSKDQARRMLAILNILQENAQIPIEQISSLLEISLKETTKLVEKLACCGLDDFLLMPLYVDGDTVNITDDLPALRAPLRLSSAEARALISALKRAGIAEGDPLEEKLIDAAATPAFDIDLARKLSDQNERLGISDVLKKLSFATEEKLFTQIEYQKPGDNETEQRVIEPLQVMLENETWYVRAWCQKAGALRNFRIDRIRDIRLSRQRFTPREFEPTWELFPLTELPQATIHLSAPIDPLSLSWPGLAITETNPDGSTVVTVPYSGNAWIATEVISLLGEAQVLEPVAVRDEVKRRAELMLLESAKGKS